MKLLVELVINLGSLNVIVVKVKNFLIVVKDEVNLVDDVVEEEFFEFVVENFVELFELLVEKKIVNRMVIGVYFKDRIILKWLGVFVFNYSSLNIIDVKLNSFLLILKDEVEDEFDEEFL